MVLSTNGVKGLYNMSAPLGSDDFYQNLLQYMNHNTTTSPVFTSPPATISPMSFSTHEAEKHSRDETMTDANESKRRGVFSVVDKSTDLFVESSNSQAVDSGSDEPDSKPKKKPGRKMMMTEPANVMRLCRDKLMV